MLGLALLWAATRAAERTVLQFRDIDRTMNWAYVRVQGTVVRWPSYDPQSGYLSFWLDDGSGELLVVAYRNQSQALIDDDGLPLIGDRVTVEGTLRLKDDLYQLVIRVPEQVVCERPAPVKFAIGEITIDDLYEHVVVRGQVRQVREPYEGLTVLTTRDGTGLIDIVYSADLARLGGYPTRVVPGDSVELSGVVTLYGDNLQIALGDPTALRVLPVPIEIAPLRRIASIGADDVGRVLRIEGVVSHARRTPSAQVYSVDDTTAKIDIVLWQHVLDKMSERTDLGMGTQLEVQGIVSEYRENLELIPELAQDIQVSMPLSPLIEALTLAEITAEHIGDLVSVNAQIVRATPFSSGVRFDVQDGDITGLLLLWQNQLEACPDRSHLVPGAWISVQGKVNAYQGQLEIVPERADNVVFVEMRDLPPVPPRKIGDLSKADIGHSYAFEGRIIDSLGFSQGMRWTLSDGTGTVAVVLWQDVADGLADAASFAAGTRIQVIGKVAIYKDEIELVPSGPADISWLEGAPTVTPSPTSTVIPTLTVSPTPTTSPTATATHVPAPVSGPLQMDSGAITEAHIGQSVSVEGPLAEITVYDSGVKCYVDDGTGRVAVWLLRDLFEQVYDVEVWRPGNVLRVAGHVQAYDGKVEVVPELVSQIRITEVAPAIPGTVSRVSDLSSEYTGQRITVQGTAVEIIPFSKGINVLLDDGSGRITLLLWQSVLDTVPCRGQLAAGITMRATGRLDEYKGALEVVLGIGSELEFTCELP
jgi:DNA/RNA endonuclease YhcR with UshA esterase domain